MCACICRGRGHIFLIFYFFFYQKKVYQIHMYYISRLLFLRFKKYIFLAWFFFDTRLCFVVSYSFFRSFFLFRSLSLRSQLSFVRSVGRSVSRTVSHFAGVPFRFWNRCHWISRVQKKRKEFFLLDVSVCFFPFEMPKSVADRWNERISSRNPHITPIVQFKKQHKKDFNLSFEIE